MGKSKARKAEKRQVNCPTWQRYLANPLKNQEESEDRKISRNTAQHKQPTPEVSKMRNDTVRWELHQTKMEKLGQSKEVKGEITISY